MERRFHNLSEEEMEAAGEAFEAEADALLEYLNNHEKETTFLLNPHRVEQMEFSYMMLLKSIIGIEDRVSISYSVSSANRTVAVIRLEGENIEAKDIKLFSRACEFADATDIYPLVNGMVRVEYTFRNIYAAA